MKNSLKKKLLIAVSFVVAIATIVAISVYSTIAYLTASSKVSNVFTVGNVYLEMFESEVDANGTKDSTQTGKKTSDGNSYKLVPGTTYDKDPTIYIQAGSEASYLFVLVRNDIRKIEAQNDPTHPTMREQMIANGWVEYTYPTPSQGTYAWVYHGFDADGDVNENPTGVEGGASGAKVNLFETFTIDENADVSIYGGAGVTLTAIGIQVRGFNAGTDAQGNAKPAVNFAWDAVLATYPFIYDIAHDKLDETQTPNP